MTHHANGSLAAQVAAVTGSTRGIGRAIALRLAQEGFSLALTSEEPHERLEEVARECVERNSRISAATVRLDLSDGSAPERFIEFAAERFGRIDVLVSNAGARCRRPFGDFSLHDIDALIALNFRAGFMAAQAASLLMVGQGGGRIIFIGSDLGLVARPEASLYGAMKAALIHLARSMAVELACKGVVVNVVSPGSTATEANQARIENEPGFGASRTDLTPAGRWASADEVAEAVSFLATCRTTFIQGTNLVIDGGYTCR